MTQAKVPTQFFGHKNIQNLIIRQLDSGTLPHALLFSGPAGVGKVTLATLLARAQLCEAQQKEDKLMYRACGECENCRMFRSGNHPDFLRIDCTEKTSNTEAVRELLHVLHLKPYTGSSRTVVLESADYLPNQALNVLLKAIEEPHSGTFFVLTTSNRSRLLPTIVSRCQLYTFSALEDLDLSSIIEEQFSDLLGESTPEERRLLVELSDGSLDRFLHLRDKLNLWKQIRAFITACMEQKLGIAADAIVLARELGDKEKQSPSIIFELLVLACRRTLKEISNDTTRAICSVAIINTLEADRLVRERNLNPTYTLQLVLSELANHSRDPLWEVPDGLSQYLS